jgi:hypothetical protein
MNPADVFKDLATTTAVVLALTQMVKVFITNKKYHPMVAVAWGVLFSYAMMWFSMTEPVTKQLAGVAIGNGLLAGLAAGGLYDSARKPSGGTAP